MTTTPHYTRDTFAFFDDLAAHNDREWWLANKERYTARVLEPTRDLASHIEALYGPVHFFRPNRDVRFSRDKSPYKLTASFFIAEAGGTGLYYQLSSSGILLGGGNYEPAADQLAAWRELFNDPKKTADVKSILADLEVEGITVMRENAVKTAPRGYGTDHPEIGSIRLKNFVVSKEIPKSHALDMPALLDEVLATAKVIEKWNALIRRYIGASTIEKKW